MNIDHLISQKRVFIFLGPGGVGKTSCAASLAIRAARQGKRVALLSIDPARRLADALGLKLGKDLTPVKFPPNRVSGQLSAAMIDQKLVFDSMVNKYSRHRERAQEILNHSLYVAVSQRLSGLVEYMALAKLQELVDEGSYDFIVLDTPPDTHALEFLEKPNVLANFVDHKVMSWLIKPIYFANYFGRRAPSFLHHRITGGLEKIVGTQAFSVLSEFLLSLSHIIEGFHSSSSRVRDILMGRETAFSLITRAHETGLQSARNLVYQLGELGFQLDLLILNRVLPSAVSKEALLRSQNLNGSSCYQPTIKRASFEKEMTEKINLQNWQKGRPIPYLSLEETTYNLEDLEALLEFSGKWGVENKIYEEFIENDNFS